MPTDRCVPHTELPYETKNQVRVLGALDELAGTQVDRLYTDRLGGRNHKVQVLVDLPILFRTSVVS